MSVLTGIVATVGMLGTGAASPSVPGVVRLLPGEFLTRQQANGEYLLRLEPGRLLHGFYLSAGLPPQGERYGGWESMGVAGHTLGHLLSALSHQFAASGDVRFQTRLREIVAELARCQAARKDGYIGAIPDADRVWEELKRGEIRSAGFDLNGLWVPWYTQHKVFAGLIDAVEVGRVAEALPLVRRLGEWALDVTANLTPEQWQRMLACEHGGMNESLAELSGLTGDRRFLELARKFHHDAVLNPLAAREDRLAGLHANTQIPKLIGLARLYELEGRPEDRAAAEFFWDRIVKHRTYAMGGNSDHEHLTEPDKLNDFLSANSAETCNTYNMLKLTRHLDAWQPDARRYDYYEGALFNHIAASQRPADAMMTYYVPLQPLATRPFSTPFDSFWCCVGTGIENHARTGEGIYSAGPDELRVNLFIGNDLTSPRFGSLRLEANLSESDRVSFSVRRAASNPDWTLALRKPAWVSMLVVRVNGKPVEAPLSPDGYFRIRREWKPSDRVEWVLPMRLRTEPMPDNPRRVALMFGPFVLVAQHGPAASEDGGEVPPVIVPGRRGVGTWLNRAPGSGLRFRSNGVLRPADLDFIPFHQAWEGRTTTYFDLMTPQEWRRRATELKQEAEDRAAEARATVDQFRPGEMQPERDHAFAGERTETGEHSGRKWRHAVDGWFSFRMKVDPAVPQTLSVDLWSGDVGRRYRILVNGQLLVSALTTPERRVGFITRRFPLPIELTRGKAEVEIRFVAEPGSIAGGLYGARIVRTPQS